MAIKNGIMPQERKRKDMEEVEHETHGPIQRWKKMINKVILIGRLTRDPELRKTQSDASVVSYTIAVNRRVQTPGQPDADFINCVAWNKIADLMEQYLHKGSLVGVEGRIQTRSYDNQQGQRVYVTEIFTESIQFLESKNSTSSNDQPDIGYQELQQSNNNTTGYDPNETLNIDSDDLPF